jgi:class 3 adenylate cyclase/tetratricopeptide (TPR) repeat protein
MTCASCGTENASDRKFCGQCGSPLAVVCPACSAPNPPEDKFCGECGSALGAAAAAAPTPASERRLVTVLFADLVGFTALSEKRDAEEVRELLSRYFNTAERLMSLYGGTVEKFIGDAVMTVWGTPVAQEDDAERAVRAALDLVAAVADLAPGVRARAGVLTGEAAVTIGATGQGMVAGDLVNTASRIQSAAQPGTVLVGEATKRATEAAIAYEPAGEHELKGKAERLQLWRATRVTGFRRGALKAAGLEPPYVGRERELRVVKELFNATAEESKAHLVSVIGIAGFGKSRLTWEFRKYIDGIAELIAWQSGRCLAYGEGVAYWALAEMVRMRAEIVEGEEPGSAREKLHAAVESFVEDLEEREWIEPRLAHLLGLSEGQAHERDDLFASWRVFLERIAEKSPTVLVFEDIHWADPSLLDFIEYLLEWSRNRRIFVLTLARPDLLERRPNFGVGSRNATTLSLEPLSQRAMEELLTGFVPGLPEELRAQILDRAEGVPLYAVETVRMLLDRGLLEREGDVYRPTGPIEALDVPETLHALVAARLDGLEAHERRLLQDASVLGKTFTKAGLLALSGLGESDLEPLLTSLTRKEFLSVQADPRSPERGQYGFMQDLLKHVAYETLSKRDRKARHLAAAAHLERSFGSAEQEIVEVVAAHYRDAYEAAPDDPDAAEIKAKARAMLARAGERAASLAATEEAQHYFEHALELADDPLVEAELRERAGEMAALGLHYDEAEHHYRRALDLLEAAGEIHPAARVSALLGEVEWATGHLDEAIERMERAFAVLSAEEPDADVAALATHLGRFQFFHGDFDRAWELLELGVSLAEAFLLPEITAQALNSCGVIALYRNRPETAQALYAHSLKIALEHDLPTAALRAYNNLGDGAVRRDRYEDALPSHESGLALARKIGSRRWEWQLLVEKSYVLLLLGRWDEALAALGEIPDSELAALPLPPQTAVEIEAGRGNVAEAKRAFVFLEHFADSIDLQQRGLYDATHAIVLRLEGDFEGALAAAERAFADVAALGTSHQTVKTGFVGAVEASLTLDRLDKAEAFITQVENLRPGEKPPFLLAHASRFQARLAAARGENDAVDARFTDAERIFREFRIPFWLGVTELEHAEWLGDQGRPDEAEPLLNEAREIFERLEAAPWLERANESLRADRTAVEVQ